MFGQHIAVIVHKDPGLQPFVTECVELTHLVQSILDDVLQTILTHVRDNIQVTQVGKNCVHRLLVP